jgi:hypothetical protein
MQTETLPDPVLVNIKPDIHDQFPRDPSPLLEARAAQPGATLVTYMLRDESPRTQANMWSR